MLRFVAFCINIIEQALGSSRHEKKRAREKETREERGRSLIPRVSPSSAPVLSFAHYFQAPITQATTGAMEGLFFKTP